MFDQNQNNFDHAVADTPCQKVNEIPVIPVGRERSSTISQGNFDAMEQLKEFQKIHMIGARKIQTQNKTQSVATAASNNTTAAETRHIQYEFEKPSVPKYRRSSIPYVHLLEEAINTKSNKTMNFVEIMKYAYSLV